MATAANAYYDSQTLRELVLNACVEVLVTLEMVPVGPDVEYVRVPELRCTIQHGT